MKGLGIPIMKCYREQYSEFLDALKGTGVVAPIINKYNPSIYKFSLYFCSPLLVSLLLLQKIIKKLQLKR